MAGKGLRMLLERFSNFYVAFLASFKVAFTSTAVRSTD